MLICLTLTPVTFELISAWALRIRVGLPACDTAYLEFCMGAFLGLDQRVVLLPLGLEDCCFFI